MKPRLRNAAPIADLATWRLVVFFQSLLKDGIPKIASHARIIRAAWPLSPAGNKEAKRVNDAKDV